MTSLAFAYFHKDEAVGAWAWPLFLENSSGKLGVPLSDDSDHRLQSFPPEKLDDDTLSFLGKWYVAKLSQKKERRCHEKLQPYMDEYKVRAEKAKEEVANTTPAEEAEKTTPDDQPNKNPPVSVKDWQEGHPCIAWQKEV